MKEQGINVELLEKLAQTIEGDPRGFDMGEWANFVIEDDLGRCELPDIQSPEIGNDRHACFTTACIAGWAVFLSESSLVGKETGDIEDRASELLRLDPEQSSRLFFVGEYPAEVGGYYRVSWHPEPVMWTQEKEDYQSSQYWPRQFSVGYTHKPKTPEDYANNARLGAARIRHFIATGGAE